LAHILAYAVQELYPGTKFGIGPAVENGFYYDFELPCQVSPEDLPKIEKKIKELLKENLSFKKRKAKKASLLVLFKKQPYKLELAKEAKEKEISLYKSGKFVDLCKGPHVKSAKEINPDAFKLTKIAGAYWRGDEKRPMLTRIYGIAFRTKKELKKFLEIQEEAEKRDHRVLGQKLELFLLDEKIGAGLPVWQPKGMVLRKIIEDYLYKELTSKEYQWIASPHIGKLSLWKTSGHWDLYRENMYSPIKIEEEQYILKPMNCPFQVKVFQSKIRSYRDLPIKYAELGTVYRYERSGVLHGLTRVRGFTQDDAHIWCTPEQTAKEVTLLLKEGLKILKRFGFKNFNVYVSTKPEKYAGTDKEWKKATNILIYALKKARLKYETDPGGGVFYGPKIDIKIKDSLNREWQCTTVQVDFNLPERFDVTYIDKKGRKERPIMIHRALLGSVERFVGVLIEHCAGAFPFWLSPVQLWIIPISDRHEKYAQKIKKQLMGAGFRAELKNEKETVSKKIREGEMQKIPYMLVVGDKEIQDNSVRVRERNKGDIGLVELTKFMEKL